jgi:hypothetical protein
MPSKVSSTLERPDFRPLKGHLSRTFFCTSCAAFFVRGPRALSFSRDGWSPSTALRIVFLASDGSFFVGSWAVTDPVRRRSVKRATPTFRPGSPTVLSFF